jgi:dTDP-4-amino-4,6-dideoxygalactose transaminase
MIGQPSLRFPGPMPPPIEPLHVPRLPVLGWGSLFGPERDVPSAVIDLKERIFVRSGRAAIALALEALGIGRGDRVLVPTYHCPTMIAPVVAAGATPEFFPIDSAGAPDLSSLPAQRLASVRAMIAAHYFGLPQPFTPTRAFCDRNNIAFVEDCAHAMFGMAGGRPIGSWGDFAIASLTKFFPVTDGGCLASHCRPLGSLRTSSRPTLDEFKSVAAALELGVQHGRFTALTPLLRMIFPLINGLRRTAPSPYQDVASDTGTPSDANRWVLDIAGIRARGFAATRFSRWVAQHARRERIVSLRRRNYGHLLELVAGLPGTRPLFPVLPEAAAPYVFPLFVDKPDRYYQRVRAAGIPIFRWDDCWPTTPIIEGDRGVAWATQVFQLGCHQDLAPDDLERVAAALRRIFSS